MEFLILGPIEARTAKGAIALGGIKPRAVLAVLLLHPNEPVSAERLALALWGEDAPGGAVKTVQVHVSRLRKALGDPAAVTTSAAGYSLRVRRGELDAERFEGLVEDAREAFGAQPETAAALLREALALWRGPALAELALEPFAGNEIRRLEEQRLAALGLRVDADLAAGRHAEVVGELRQLVVEYPTRERFVGQLMLALYRCGRQTEALDAYATARRELVDDVGVEPGPELRELHEAILRQDVALAAQPVGEEPPAALDTTTAKPLVGRADEVAWLVERWERARDGAGMVVALTGARGSGKSRLTAELARAVHGPGVSILHVTGLGPADAILVALRRLRDATRPTLLVVDDADSAGTGVQSEIERLAAALAGAPVLIVVVATERDAVAYVPAAATLELAALDAEAVREIASTYAPGRAAADVPAEWLLDASGGVARRVHDVASQWARREAARHVGAVVDRAVAGRAELRAIEEELAGGVFELQESGGPGGPGGPARPGDVDEPPVVCPYKGLASYDVGDAPYFFGREQLVAELVARLVGTPLLGIVGHSGSGKSSVLRAGLLPALASGVLPGSERWSRALMRPGEHPRQALRDALEGTPGDARLVLAIDQFEELFTACDDERERAEFVDELVELAHDAHGRFVVVLALRADSYGRCAAYPELAALLAASNVLVGAMQRDELQRVVERPAQRAGLRIEPELVDALVADVEREPGGLPLLSTALLELWQHRDGRRLRHAAYERMGGVHGAVARLAEEAFAQLDPSQQAIARSVLMRLVGVGEEDAVERRRIALEELEIERDEDVARVVALLTDRRLLTVSAGTVELAHEALLREWPRLRGWVDDDREGLRIRRGLNAAAHEWDALRRDEGALYRGARLSEAREWRDAQEPSLNELERSFLDASQASRQRERTTRRRRMALVLSALSIGLLAAVGAAIFANGQRANAVSRELAARSANVIGADPSLARALAVEALDRADTPQAQSALRQATLEDRATAAVQAHKTEAFSVDANRDGSIVVSGGDDGKVSLWHTHGLRPARTLTTHGDAANSAVFSPDGESVASASFDGSIALTPAAGGKTRTLRTFPKPEEERAFRLDMAPGVVVAGTTAGGVWMLPTGVGSTPYELGRHKNQAARVVVAISPDGKTVFSADDAKEGLLWDVASRSSTPVAVETLVYAASFSNDGKRFAAAGDDGRVRIWDVATGELVRNLDLGFKQLFSVRFSGDDSRVVTAASDYLVQIKDVASGQEISRMAGANAVRAVFTAGGEVVSADADGKLHEWRPLEVKVPRRPAASDAFTFASFTRGGEQVVSGDITGGVHLWDLERGDEALPGHDLSAVVAASADGALVVSAAVDGTAKMYDAEHRVPRPLEFPDFEKYAVAVSTTGRIAVAGGPDGNGAFPIVVQDADGGNSIRLTGHKELVDALDFSSDATHLASGSGDGTARVWDLRTRKSRSLEVDEDTVRWVSYSDDDKRLVTAGADGTVRVWPLGGGDPVVLFGHEGPVNTAELNHRGDRIVSTGADGTVRVWDAAGGDTIVVLVRHTASDGSGAEFSPNGRYVVSSGADGMRITRCEVCDGFDAVERVAATRASRPLTARERERLGLD